MEDYTKASQTGNSYSERAIYDEIVANLDGYGIEASELNLNQHIFNDDRNEMCEEMEDPRLSYVMNDHNYILNNRHSRISLNVRQNLIDFVKKNSASACQNSIGTPVEKLIDIVLNLLSKVKDYDSVIEKVEEVCDPKPAHSTQIKPDSEEILKDCKDQSVNNQLSEIVKIDLKSELDLLVKETVNVSEVIPTSECDAKPSLIKADDAKLDEKPLELKDESMPILDGPSNIIKKENTPEINKKTEEPTESSDTEHSYSHKTKEPKAVIEDLQATNSESPGLEVLNKVEKNDSLTKNILELPDVISKLTIFAEKLKEDCANLPQKREFNLECFLSSKSKEYKDIVSCVLCVDTSIQTEKVVSKKKLRKINAQDKRHLLESSNDSDSSTSSYIDKTLNKLEGESKKSRKQFFKECPSSTSKDCLISKKHPSSEKYYRSDSDSDDECVKSDLSQFDESMCSSSKNENDENDQIGPSSDTEKETDKPKISSTLSQESLHNVTDKQDQTAQHSHDKNRGKSMNESDKENRSIAVSPERSVLTKSKQEETIEEDIQEKEIERLLNLKGLAEPQKNTSLTNNSKSHKHSNKFSSKSDSLYAVMQEIDKNSLSDDSVNEDSEQILTEKQFLVKCNENLKQQLLNSASSDSDNFNSDVDLNLINKSNEHSGDEDDHRLSYVDKFLETLIDNEDNSPASTQPPKITSPIKITDNKKMSINTIDMDKTSLTTNSSTDQNTFGLKKTEHSQKTLENILSNEKRQKTVKIHEDLIDLSAESCNSDVEEYPTETKEKSQRIKPMLRQDQLESETIYAQKKEADRLRRLEKRNTYLSKLLKGQNEGINEKDFVLDYSTINKKFIKVHPEIVKHLKPHQRDGLKFMYDSCYGCVDSVKYNSGSGCILAHCMGLGKTLQIIALLHTVTSYKELKTSKVLVLCPKSTIMNWADEIQRWLGPLDVKNLQIFNFSDTADIYEKINVLRQWSASSVKAGCLIMGYEAFRALVFYHSNKGRAKSNVRVEDIRTSINKYLLKPGADLVVCDEGHIIKNRKSGISLAAAEIVTPKRIILTGTPIQNNLKEYYSMVNFIKPLILGTEKEFANLYANPIKNGQHKDSSKRDIKVMKQRSFVLHKKLSKFVQRKEAELLQSFLPQKFEYVLFIPMTDVQNNLYEFVLEAISKREDSRGRGLITDYTCLRKIWSHPKVLEDAWKNAIAAKNKREPKRQSNNIAHSDDDQPDDIYDSQTGVISVQCDWWRSLVTDTDLESILPSNKLKTMFEIIRMSEENAFVAVLNVVEYFFNKINDKQRNFFLFEMPEKTTGHWINGQDYYRLDGKTNKTLRHEMVKRFNDPKNKRARVFLISAKAGGQGINLIGANRVIILDTSWNPANDQQNIFRIFRLGQKKNCYVYRLIAMGTMEEKVYSRSVTKQAMSFRVVDEQQIDRHYNMAELAELYTLTKPCYNERPVPVFPQDQILANLLLNFPDLVYKYHEHDSLLENKVEQELSEQEKADAWVAYERDLQLNSESRDVMEGYNGYPLFGQGNYMYPIGYDPKNLLPGNCDLNQMDIASRNALGSSLLPNYMVNRNSYLDILNMYKNFSSSLLNEKSNRASRFNTNYAMSLASGMMNNPAMCNALSSNDSHLSALTNPFYPLHSLANTNSGLIPNPNLSNSSHISSERYEQNKSIISAEDTIASAMRNYPSPMPPYPKDFTSRSLHPKNLLHSPPTGPSSTPNILHSPPRQLPQNVFSTNIGKDGIPKNVIQKKRGKITTKPSLMHSGSTLELAAKSKTTESLLRSTSPTQNIGIPEPAATEMFEQPSNNPVPVNMGIVYPKQISLPLSPVSESSEGTCIVKKGSSMQIIPTHSPLTENVRKKFDNISPNISLTAVRQPPKTLQPEQLSTSNLEITPSNIRKRRSSLGNSVLTVNDKDQIYSSPTTPRTPSVIDTPSYPPAKVSKY